MGWIEGLHKFLQLELAIGEPIMGYTSLVFGIPRGTPAKADLDHS